MITLKKSFELQNYLGGLFEDALRILAYTDNITTTEQKHMRKKAYSDAENETIIKPKNNEYSFTVIELVDFAAAIQTEINRLTTAINIAKHSGENDFDGMIAINNSKRKLLSRLESMADIKPKTVTKTGQAYKFNGEGNQVAYTYDIEEVTTIDFDRNQIKAIVRRLRKELEEFSTAIDTMQLTTMVDFETIYEIGDKLEDAVDKFKENR